MKAGLFKEIFSRVGFGWIIHNNRKKDSFRGYLKGSPLLEDSSTHLINETTIWILGGIQYRNADNNNVGRIYSFNNRATMMLNLEYVILCP